MKILLRFVPFWFHSLFEKRPVCICGHDARDHANPGTHCFCDCREWHWDKLKR